VIRLTLFVLICTLTACSFDTSGVPPLGAVDESGVSLIDGGHGDSSATPNSDAISDAPSPSDADIIPTHDGPQAKDQTPPPDVPLPDLPPPDLPSTLYVYETFSSGMGAVQPKRGSWSISNGELHQTSKSGNDYYAEADVLDPDYVVESVVTVHSIHGYPSLGEGAGISARMQQPIYPSDPPGQYSCGVFPDWGDVALGKATGYDSTFMTLKSAMANISTGKAYYLRLTVIGDSLMCELPDQQVVLTATDTSFPSGGAGLVTLYADASYQYFKVSQP
jgi:hypothetical protein